MIGVIPKMDFGVEEMGFVFCGKHPVLVTRTQVSDPGPIGPLVFFPESSHVAYQFYGNEAENTMQANILPVYTPTTPGCGQNLFFLKKVMLHIKLNGKCRTLCKQKCFDLMHTPDFLGWVRTCTLMDLSELIGFGYDLNDAQDGLVLE